ncbi:MAG: Fe-S cluster assembly scaffold IscU [Deltaproteobacteria bacterium]|nr:Fe-S cluster assembly scaffold IscU [Deltaproteobacteria bacterium]
MAYSDKVIDHYENPRNVGSMDKADPNVGTGLVGAPACGDVMKLQLRVSDDGVIEDAKFKTFGCGSAIASSSLVTEWVKGKKVDEANTLSNSQIAEELALPPVKIHCSVLAEEAVKAAIYDYKHKKGLLTVHEVFDHESKMAGAHRAEGESDDDVAARVRAATAAYASKHGKSMDGVAAG